MAEYRSFAGFVQFDPADREVGDQSVRNVRIQAVNTDKYVDITVWPSHASTPIVKGDFVIAQGTYTTRESGGKLYHNLNGSQLVVIPSDAGSDEAPAVKVKATKASTKTDEDLF